MLICMLYNVSNSKLRETAFLELFFPDVNLLTILALFFSVILPVTDATDVFFDLFHLSLLTRTSLDLSG